MKFKIEQVAIHPANPAAAIKLLTEMGCAEEWVRDTVSARGRVHDWPVENKANLAFDYTALTDAREFEVLEYTDGINWMQGHNRASHFGMHCSEEDLAYWFDFFNSRGIKVAQEVRTYDHTNPAIKDSRRYHYVIFDTYEILGIDIKFIVRHEIPSV